MHIYINIAIKRKKLAAKNIAIKWKDMSEDRVCAKPTFHRAIDQILHIVYHTTLSLLLLLLVRAQTI